MLAAVSAHSTISRSGGPPRTPGAPIDSTISLTGGRSLSSGLAARRSATHDIDECDEHERDQGQQHTAAAPRNDVHHAANGTTPLRALASLTSELTVCRELHVVGSKRSFTFCRDPSVVPGIEMPIASFDFTFSPSRLCSKLNVRTRSMILDMSGELMNASASLGV